VAETDSSNRPQTLTTDGLTLQLKDETETASIVKEPTQADIAHRHAKQTGVHKQIHLNWH
jgi:hypothetical protein